MFSKTVSIARELIDLDPQFYRNVMLSTNSAVPEVNRNRLMHWKQLIDNAVAEGFLLTFTDSMELAVHLRVLYNAPFQRWAKQEISSKEAEAKANYAITLALAGFATPTSRHRLQSDLRAYQETLRVMRINKLSVANRAKRTAEH